MKRLFDLIGSLIGLIILLPILMIIAISIKLDSKGPVIFKQKRLGKNGEIFLIYKFRTMVENAEDKGMGVFTNKSDPRITRVGKFLRKISLDELLQLFNVIKGEMSIVGPRPPVPYHPYKYNEYNKKQRLRFTVRPGITGYAQVNGRNKLSWNERIKYDIKYVKNYSFLLDFKIIIKTFLTIINLKNIYRK